MQKILRRLTAMALLVLLLCLMASTALAMPFGLGSSWGDRSYFDDDDRIPWGSGRLGSSWGDRSYFDDDDRIPWGSGRFGSSWGDRSYFDDDDRIPWGSGRLSHGQAGSSLIGEMFLGNSLAKAYVLHVINLTSSLSSKLFSVCAHLRTVSELAIGCKGRLLPLLWL